jgi:hypothetical protein
MSRERNDWGLPGTIVAALVILVILGNMERVTRETLSAQLTDTQRQIADLENNISSLAIRNIVGLVGGWVLGRKELSRIMISTRRILFRLRGIVTGSFADGGGWISTMNNNSLNTLETK